MMRLTARDTVDSGLNAENSLEASQYSQFFTIDPDSGDETEQISMKKALDYEMEHEYNLTESSRTGSS